jgi:hypothetical protein
MCMLKTGRHCYRNKSVIWWGGGGGAAGDVLMSLIVCALSTDRLMIMVTTFRRMGWAKHVTRIEEISNFT